MKLDDFEVAVIDLAHEGVRLTIPNVVARLKVKPDEAERWLDAMCKKNRLDVDIDEDEAVLVYRVRGLTVKKAQPRAESAARIEKALAPIGRQVVDAALEKRGLGGSSPLPENEKKSILLGFGLGLILPGLGLFYAAPWLVAAGATLVAIVVMKLASIIPLIGWALGGTFALGSGVAGGLYAARYNREGKRAPLLSDAERKKLLGGGSDKS
jgi:hypothetical protein